MHNLPSSSSTTMYMNGVSWDPWVGRAKARGYESSAPSWPFHDGIPAELRAKVPDGLENLTFGAVVDHLKKVVAGLPTPPVLIGHSIGGLVVQKLINDGFGVVGVAISQAPPQGIVTLDPTFFKADFPHINPFAGNKPVIMTPSASTTRSATPRAWPTATPLSDTYVTLESRNVPRSHVYRAGPRRLRPTARPAAGHRG
jgi:pimeloyl-ACP methyl ester carboxylesterase